MNNSEHIQAGELLSVLFHSPNATAVYSGEDITILSVNAAMLSLWGKDRSVLGKTFKDAIPEIIDQPFNAILQQVWQTGKTYVGRNEPALLNIDGKLTKFYFDFEYKAILDVNGKSKYILHTAIEVSERMTAWNALEERSKREQQLNEKLTVINQEYQSINEKLAFINEKHLMANKELHKFQHDLEESNILLKESEQRFKVLVEQAPVAMALLKGFDMEIDVVNEKVLEIWGKNSNVVGMPLIKALPELEGQPFINILQNVYTTGESFYGNEVTATLNHKGVLTEIYLNFVYKAVLESDNIPFGILIVATDVTEQVNARKSIEEVNTRLKIALDASKLGSTEVEIATGKMESTDQFKANYGYLPHEEFKYPDLFNAMLPEFREGVKQLIKESIETKGTYHAEYPIKWRDGSIHWIQAHGRPRYDNNGNADRMVGMTLDITDKKLFEQRKDDFLSIVSHELKTPITSLRGSLQLLEKVKTRPFGEIHTKLIDQSIKSVGKMQQLVEDLLNMSRMSQDQLKLDKTTFRLFDMLTMCCNHVRMEGKYDLVISGDKELMENYPDSKASIATREKIVIPLLTIQQPAIFIQAVLPAAIYIR
ncbi:MAG: PAS domain S-box protein [Pedobacter sp.]|nr:MAG: PAS domain S-box protein [Pedobacter sp.]